MTDTEKLTGTDKPPETDNGGLEFTPALLIFPAALVLAIWDNVTWAAVTAVAVGLLGVALIPVAFYYARRDAKISGWAYFVLTLVTVRFAAAAWDFLF